MANQVIGKVTYVSPTFNVETRNGAFTKRTIWVAPMYFDRDTGEPTPSEDKYAVSIEFTRDKCSLLDNILVGNLVSVPFRLRGNVFERKDGSGVDNITTIEGISILPYQQGNVVVVNEAPQAAPQPTAQPQQFAPQAPIQQPVQQSPQGGGFTF